MYIQNANINFLSHSLPYFRDTPKKYYFFLRFSLTLPLLFCILLSFINIYDKKYSCTIFYGLLILIGSQKTCQHFLNAYIHFYWHVCVAYAPVLREKASLGRGIPLGSIKRQREYIPSFFFVTFSVIYTFFVCFCSQCFYYFKSPILFNIYFLYRQMPLMKMTCFLRNNTNINVSTEIKTND